jgi:hypothetical protein
LARLFRTKAARRDMLATRVVSSQPCGAKGDFGNNADHARWRSLEAVD